MHGQFARQFCHVIAAVCVQTGYRLSDTVVPVACVPSSARRNAVYRQWQFIRLRLRRLSDTFTGYARFYRNTDMVAVYRISSDMRRSYV